MFLDYDYDMNSAKPNGLRYKDKETGMVYPIYYTYSVLSNEIRGFLRFNDYSHRIDYGKIRVFKKYAFPTEKAKLYTVDEHLGSTGYTFYSASGADVKVYSLETGKLMFSFQLKRGYNKAYSLRVSALANLTNRIRITPKDGSQAYILYDQDEDEEEHTIVEDEEEDTIVEESFPLDD